MSIDTPKILVVEDDRDQASLFEIVLAKSGYNIATELTAEAALARLAEEHYDLLLVDWDLPEMKGDDLIREAQLRCPGIKTVLFSNHSNIEDIARDSGADAWMLKIEGIVRLREIVTELLQRV